MGFGQGLSGLNAAAQELDVIGNNIANANTVGFKASTVAFGDIYATSKVGLGTKVAAVNQRFTVGTITNTGNQLDLAVDGASGMFRMQDALGNIMYTRNGQFFRDDNNFIVNAQGQRLTGFGLTGTDVAPVEVPVGKLEPIASGALTTRANLNAQAPVIYTDEVIKGDVYVRAGDATATGPFVLASFRRVAEPDPLDPTSTIYTTTLILPPVPPSTTPTEETTGAYQFSDNSSGTPAVTVEAIQDFTSTAAREQQLDDLLAMNSITKHLPKPFSPTDPDSYTHSLPITVYDSLGNSHQLTQFFIKRESDGATSNWDVYYTFNGEVVKGVVPDNPDTTTVDESSDYQRMTFNQSGILNSGGLLEFTISDVGGTSSPAANLNISLNYANSTSFSGEFSYNFSQDGFPTGDFSNIEIGQDGAIIAVYTNGERRTKGYVALADFNNLNGLRPSGDNAWVETSASGPPILGRPGSNGLALIRGQAVEESNVDMSQELVRMIISQRFYQANAQTIKTQDQILQTLITLR